MMVEIASHKPLAMTSDHPTNDHQTKRGGNKLESIELARKIVNAIADKKGSNIILLDLRSISLLADYFVICSGESERQVKAIVNEIAEKIKEEGIRPLHIEGDPSSGWVLVDYGSISFTSSPPSCGAIINWRSSGAMPR